MPYPRKKRTYSRARKAYKKHSYRRRRAYKNNPGTLVLSRKAGSPFPEKLQCTLDYASHYSFNTASGTNFFNAITAANSLYDPDNAGWSFNGQPMYFDQLTAVYARYKVKACKVTVEVTGQNGTPATSSMQLFLRPTITATADTTTWSDNPDTIRIQPYCQYKLLTCQAGDHSIVKFNGYMTTKQMFSASPNDVDLTASVAGSPANLWYWQLSGFDQIYNTSTGTLTGVAFIRIRQYVEFYQLQPNAGS